MTESDTGASLVARLEALQQEMRTIALVAGQCSVDVEVPDRDGGMALMAAAEAGEGRCLVPRCSCGEFYE